MKRRAADRMLVAVLVGGLILGAGLLGLTSVYLGKVSQALAALQHTEGLADYPGRPAPVGVDARAAHYLVLTLDSSGALTAVVVAHLSRQRGDIVLVALPGNLMVTDAGRARTLADLYASGPAEVGRVVECLLGVRMDHLAVAVLPRFAQLVDVVGGVRVPNPEPAGRWPAGPVVLDGAAAAAYVDLGGADIVRFQRSATVLAAVLSRLADGEAMTRAARLDAIAGHLAASVQVDPSLTPEAIRATVLELRLAPGAIVTAPLPLARVADIDGRNVAIAQPSGLREVSLRLLQDRPPEPTAGDPWAALAQVPRR